MCWVPQCWLAPAGGWKGIAMPMPRYDQHQWHAQLIHSRVEMAQLCTFFFLCLILQVLFVFCWVMVSSVTYDLCCVRHASVFCGVESRLPSAPRCNCREISAKPFLQAVSRSCPRHAGWISSYALPSCGVLPASPLLAAPQQSVPEDHPPLPKPQWCCGYRSVPMCTLVKQSGENYRKK